MTEPEPEVIEEQHPDEDAPLKHNREKANDDLLSPEAQEQIKEVLKDDENDIEPQGDREQ